MGVARAPPALGKAHIVFKMRANGARALCLLAASRVDPTVGKPGSLIIHTITPPTIPSGLAET